MKWNLRLVAAQRGIWRAIDLHRLLTERGMSISTGKMSNLWSGIPNSLKLDELDIFCAVLDCRVDELLTPEPVTAARAGDSDAAGPELPRQEQ
ncbi:helix-turn-helix domain-containing protein [Nocardia colli]|uniref:helix-turn-helix domain-containing protein n=1 Tax=Nocardia colli TaxID=2545717 RepID=UPI0035D6162C